MPYRMWLAADCIDMANMMGCEHWILQIIGDIASMNARKDQLDRDEICDKVSDCEQRSLQEIEKMNKSQLEAQSIHHSSHRDQQRLRKLKTHYTTLAFARSAQLLLRIISLNDVSSMCRFVDSTSTVITLLVDILNQASDVMSLRGLMWPICIAGSLAERSQQGLIRRALGCIRAEGDTSFGNCDSVIRALEMCWAKGRDELNQNTQPWLAAMAGIGRFVLLI